MEVCGDKNNVLARSHGRVEKLSTRAEFVGIGCRSNLSYTLEDWEIELHIAVWDCSGSTEGHAQGPGDVTVVRSVDYSTC